MGTILRYHREVEAGYNLGYEHGQSGKPKQSRAAAILAGYNWENTPEKRAFLRGYHQGYRNGTATLMQKMQTNVSG